MKKQLEAISLIAGTAIGSGMLSLPLVLAEYGLKFCCLLMIAFIWVAYFSSIIRAELNIHSRADFSLRDVGNFFSGPIASKIALKLLSYSLIAAYLHGLALLLKTFLDIDINIIILAISGIAIVILIFSNNLITSINKSLFILLISAFVFATLELLFKSEISELTIPAMQNLNIKSLAIAIPIIFTSFGFQGSIHSLTKFVNNDEKMIKRACLFGSIIPAFVYIIWLGSAILIISNNDSLFFQKMINGDANVGELISCLAKISNLTHLRLVFWLISLLALLTSIIGVGIAVFDEWNLIMSRKSSAFLTIIPSSLIAIIIPNAFIKVLSISGALLAILGIFLPTFLYFKMIKQNPDISISKAKSVALIMLILVGCAVVASVFSAI